MENFLEGGTEQLEAVKTALSDLAAKEQELKDTEKYLKARQKEKDIQRKRVDEKINAAVKKARNELEKGFDDQINTAEKAVRDAETEKKNAKSEAVNKRMQTENSSLIDENKILGAEISSRFKEDGVPSICGNSLYYMLFEPKGIKDYLVCGAAILICAGIVPFIITRFVSTAVLAAIVWILIAVFFGAVYFLVSSWTKKGVRHETIMKMRPNIERIADNNKFIKKTNKNIKADPDESQYNLFEFDQKIEAAKGQLSEAESRKEEAVHNFEEVDSVSIRNKMEEENASIFEEFEKEIGKMQEEHTAKEESFTAVSKTVEEYAEALGEKSLKADKIDELIKVITDGNATTIAQAIEFQKGK